LRGDCSGTCLERIDRRDKDTKGPLKVVFKRNYTNVKNQNLVVFIRNWEKYKMKDYGTIEETA